MKISNRFQRRALYLFFVVSLVPALTVSLAWYLMTRGETPGGELVAIGAFLIPAAVYGLIPALILSFIFAQLLAKPIRSMQSALHQIALGNFAYRSKPDKLSEFSEMGETLNDITETLQQVLGQLDSENKIVASERNKMRVVLDSMSDGVFALDNNNAIVLFNQAAMRITGNSLADVAGKPFDDVLKLEHGYQVHDWLKSPSRQGGSSREWHSIGLDLERDDQGLLYFDIHAVRIGDDPNGMKTLVTMRDVTASHELERMKVDFVALAAHELRTPLATIKGYLDLMQLEVSKKMTTPERSYLRRSIISANQLSGLVNNLLNVARIEHDELNYAFEPTDFSQFLADILPDLESRAKEQGRILTIKLTKKKAMVAMDRLAITEVVNNLIDNAFKHTSEGGKVGLFADAGLKELHVSVTDDGEGIPKDAQAKLFTKFYRAEGMRGGRGTGLGLYISKSIVEAHHGYIWVQSDKGRGATFGFSLPLHKEIARRISKDDNETNAVLKGAHGWIKENTHH